MRAAAGGRDLPQDRLEHGIPLLTDLPGPATTDGLAALYPVLVGPPAAGGGDDAFGAPVLGAWLDRRTCGAQGPRPHRKRYAAGVWIPF